MLYIKFTFLSNDKFTAFQKLFLHMKKVREPDFKFEEEEIPEIDWENVTQEEIDIIMDENVSELKRYKEFIPDYADAFLKRYLSFDHDHVQIYQEETLSLLNYLEYGFEVNMDHLENINKNSGLIQISTGNFPFGGLDRFFMVLKAFDLIPFECFNGFNIFTFDWVSEFEYEGIEDSKKTKTYLKYKDVHRKSFLNKITSIFRLN